MFGQSYLRRSLSLLFACALLVLPALAQKKKESRAKGAPADITILNVTKDQAAAKPNPKGRGRLVPIKLQWEIKLWEGAKLEEVRAVLKTANTDRSTSEVTQLLPIAGLKPSAPITRRDTLLLEMPEGVFAQDFTLTMISKCSFSENGVLRTASAPPVVKQGAFPLPLAAGKK